MSANAEVVQEATKLFIFQLRTRPENVIANCNSLLEGADFRLELVHTTRLRPQEASLFDPPQAQMAMEEASHESGSD